MNIVFLCADTFRRDHLGCYGNDWIYTPNLDKLAAQSLVFDRHYAASFPTMPARADYFTGRWTFTYMGWAPLAKEEVLLPELLQQAGYSTLAVVDNPFFHRQNYNYDRGFKEFIQVPGQDLDERARRARLRRFEEDCCASRTMIEAAHLLEHYRDNKFFLYVDTWDPHEPWNPPAWYVQRYMPEYDGRLVSPCYAKYQEQGLSDDDMHVARATYAGEVSMVDRWVGYLLDTLECMNLTDSTAIIFASDHGFYFGEHEGLFGKMVGTGGTYGAVEKAALISQVWFRSPLYEELAHVPLIMKIPGADTGRTSALTSAVDLMPTILELAQVDIPQIVQGLSMMPAFKKSMYAGREAVFSSLPLHNIGEETGAVDDFVRSVEHYQPTSITTEKWNLQYAASGEELELYDLHVDPGQANNLAQRHPEVVRKLHAEFVELLDQCPASEPHRKVRQAL